MTNTQIKDSPPEDDADRFKSKTSKVRGLNQDKDAKLPIIFHEREIMENIESNVVSILCGETGSGKSTQVPQFIYGAAMSQRWKFRSSETEQFEEGGSKKIMIGIT